MDLNEDNPFKRLSEYGLWKMALCVLRRLFGEKGYA